MSLFWNFIFDFKTVYFHTIFILLTVHFDAKWSSSESNIEWKNQWTWNSFYWGRNKKIFIFKKFPNFSFFFARSTKEILHWFHQFNIFWILILLLQVSPSLRFILSIMVPGTEVFGPKSLDCFFRPRAVHLGSGESWLAIFSKNDWKYHFNYFFENGKNKKWNYW